MKIIKDKEFYKVTKEELKSVKGIKNTKQALKLATINKPLFSAICIIFVLNIALSVFNALVGRAVLNIFSTHEFNLFTKYAFIILGINLMTYILSYLQSYCFEKFKKEIMLNLKTNTFRRITNLQANCFLNNQTSAFTRRLSDANEIANAFEIIFNTIENIATSLAYSIVLAITSPLLFIICASFYIVKTLIYKYLIPRYNIFRKRNKKIADEANNIAMESIRGASDIKSLNLSSSLVDSYSKKVDENFSTSLSINLWWRNRLMPTNFFAFSVNTCVLMLMIAYFFKHEIYSAGTILFFWSYRGYINNLFRYLFDIRDNFASIEVSASRLMELYDEKTFPIETFGNKEIKRMKGNIEFKNVSFEYEENKTVLDNISFKIEAKKITAIVGKTGCGKSTTLSLISRFYTPTSGEITIDGIESSLLTKESLRKNIGYVQQAPYIFNRSFRENLLLVKPDATEKEIIDACKKSEIHDFITQTKDGYDTLIGENGITLSGGQKQRLAIARALLNNAKIIMFDESTSSLDNEYQAKIQKTIENLSSSHTIIVVAHRLSTIINADKIIFMDKHKIKAEGTHQELFDTCPEYRKLYEIESKK